MPAASARSRSSSLYLQALAGVALGAVVGHFWPALGERMKPLGDGFIKLIRMLIAPIIFTTVCGGIARVGDLRKMGRVGIKTLLYFEGMTTLALAIGLGVGELIRPGSGLHANLASLDPRAIEGYATQGKALTAVDFLLNIIPSSVVDAFAKGELLQVLLFSVLMGVALSSLGERGRQLSGFIEQLETALFRIVEMIMRLAPLGAFGAMAFSVSKLGLASLASLGKLVLCFYLTSLLFVLGGLGLVSRWAGIGIFKLLLVLREQLFVVLGTSSSESVLPRLIQKMTSLGCSKSLTGLVVPLGYSFNLDGTCIYLTLATLFIGQALDLRLSLSQELALMAVLLVTSKGAAAVTGGGFIALAATLASTGTLPVAGLTLILGIDRFLSEARALTNLVGNAVATLAIARWEGEIEPGSLRPAHPATSAAVQPKPD